MTVNLELQPAIARGEMNREPYWTQSLAVEKVQPLILSRRETEIELAAEGLWMLSESPIPYSQKKGPKIAAKALN